MRITTENYEEFVLDYLEGTLNPEIRKELEDFFRENPRLAPAPGEFANLSLQSDEQKLAGKELLYKSLFDYPEKLEETAVALAEGDLTAEEAAQFRNWLGNHAEANKTVEQFARLKLQPDSGIFFPDKAKLKRKSRMLPVWWSVAAAAVLVLGVFLFSPHNHQSVQQVTSPQVAEIEEPVSIPRHEKATKSPDIKIVAEKPKESSAKTKMVKAVKLNPVAATIKPRGKLLIIKRIPLDIPAPMKARVIRFDTRPEKVVMVIEDDTPKQTLAETEPVVDILDKKLEKAYRSDDRELLSPDNIALGGLQLIARAGGRHLVGERGSDGEIKSIAFHSRLISFSLPVNKNR